MLVRRAPTRFLTRGLAGVGAGALLLHGWRLGQTLGGAPARYHVDRGQLPPDDSDAFLKYVSTVTGAAVRPARVALLRNGEQFYPAELAAIQQAQHSINLEAYEFLEGAVTRDFLDRLIDRARNGVAVRLILDAIGSWKTHSSYFGSLRAAGGQVAWYHRADVNHRTHRKLLVIDGTAGFIGGAGFADRWLHPNQQGPRWRDTMLRVEGQAVAGLNSVFAENWLETTGEILAGADQFPSGEAEPGLPAMVVSSTPRKGATHARMLYQILIEGARRSIRITTPYFVPDRSARKTLEQAAKRGVSLQILTAGPHSDHPTTRRLGRGYLKALDKAGAEIYEYQPSMIHAKLMTIDGLWTVAGSTNFDHRSFDLNDEVNIVISDGDIASQVDQDFAHDLEQSRQITLRRPEGPGLTGQIVRDTTYALRRDE